MSIFSDFFKRLAGIISGESKSQNTRFRMRRLHFEVLESRELLSANPIDGSTFDWSWGENSESPPVIYLPQIDVYAINSSGCAPFTPVDFLLSDNIQVKDNDSLGGDINTGGSGAASQIQIDDTSNLNCSNTGIIATYTIDNNFIGSDLISYDIQGIDQESNSTVTVASGFIAVEVLPDNVGGGEQIELPAGFNIDVTSSSFGQISIGGSGSQIGVSGEFTPPTNDTYTVSVSLSSDSVARSFSGVTGTGSETLDIKISSDFFANGDWFYAETANFSYSISTDTGIFWGGYSYSLFAGSIGGNYHHTFILNGTDYFFITENVTDQQSSNVTNSYTSQVIGGTVNTTYIQYSDDSNQITSTEIHNTAAASHNISYGTYQYTVSGGTVDGTFTKTGESQSSSHQKIINVTENNQTTATGNFAITSQDETKYIYAASGDYLIEVTTEESEDFTLNTGTITESGFTIDTSNYSINGVLDSSGEWTNNGSATLTHEYESNFYNYDKFKFLITDSDANGNWTDNGRYITETETQQWGELTTTNSLVLSEQGGESEWKTVSGSGSNDITTYDFTDNKVKRTYDQTGSADGKTWSVSGTTKQRDKTEYETEKQVVSVWNNSLESWVYTGEGTGNGSNFSKLKLDESGTYESTTTQDNIEFSITDGTVSRSSLDKSETTFTTESELVDGVWVDSGTGSATGISKSQSEYSGEGTFDLTIDDTRITNESNVMTGDVEESGNEKYKSTWTSETELQDGEWVTVNGSGETTSKGKTLFTFDGEVDTTEQYTEDNTEYDLDTTRKLSGKEKNKWDTTATNAVIDGQWKTTAGSGTSDSLSLQENSIDSSGSYTTSVSGESGFEIDGDIDLGESNSEKITSTNTLSWNATTDEWEMSSIIDFKIQTENYCDKTSSSGSFWENEPSTTVTAGCNLSDGSTGTLVTQSSGSLTGDLTEEIHTTYTQNCHKVVFF